jgi:hypothetical protein
MNFTLSPLGPGVGIAPCGCLHGSLRRYSEVRSDLRLF